MNSPLNNSPDEIESFLAETARHMGKVPADRQDTFLREVRSHIETLAEDYEGQGLKPADASRAAIKMMGLPSKIGRSYARTWYRASEPGSVLSAIAVAGMSIQVLHTVFMPIEALLRQHHQLAGDLPIGLAVYTVPGLLSGWIFPKRAALGSTVSMALLSTTGLVNWIVIYHTSPHGGLPGITSLATLLLTPPILTLVSAAAARRWRMRRFAGI